ncbi:MAG: hypothetical protein ABEL76_15925, partial [Bradymonadaceae bacterium]
MSEGSEQSPTQLVRREYERRISKIADLPELEMRSSSVRRVLTGLAPEVALVWMDQIIRGAIWGRTDDLQVAVALAHWLINRDGGDEQYTFFEQIYRSAHEAEVDGVLYVLRNAPPHQEMRPEAELPEVRLPMDRDPDEIPIGERRTLARRADVDVLKRLALDPSPLVIRNLLSNPDLTEEEVLRIASRRPTDPAIL